MMRSAFPVSLVLVLMVNGWMVMDCCHGQPILTPSASSSSSSLSSASDVEGTDFVSIKQIIASFFNRLITCGGLRRYYSISIGSASSSSSGLLPSERKKALIPFPRVGRALIPFPRMGRGRAVFMGSGDSFPAANFMPLSYYQTDSNGSLHFIL